jgi:hypothetical protein
MNKSSISIEKINSTIKSSNSLLGRLAIINVLINGIWYNVTLRFYDGTWMLFSITHDNTDDNCSCHSMDENCELFDQNDEMYIFNEIYKKTRIKLTQI